MESESVAASHLLILPMDEAIKAGDTQAEQAHQPYAAAQAHIPALVDLLLVV